MTSVPLDLIKVQIQTWEKTASVLGLTTLGSTALGGSALWVDLLGDATALHFNRGGSISGVTTSLDVGTLSITLKNIDDPRHAETWLIPNLPIRVLRDELVIFSGNIESIQTSYDVENTFVTITATDAIKELSNVKVTGFTTFRAASTPYERIDSILSHSKIQREPLGTWYSSADRAVFNPFTSSTGWAKWGDWQDSNAVAVAAGTLSVFGLYDSRSFRLYNAYSKGISYDLTGLTIGATYTVNTHLLYDFWSDGVTKGVDEAWRTYALGVDIDGVTRWGAGNVIPGGDYSGVIPSNAEVGQLSLTFTATATSHLIRLARAYTGQVGVFSSYPSWYDEAFNLIDFGVWRVMQPTDTLKQLQDTLVEQSLTEHLELACNSSGLDWWIGQDNRVRFMRQDETLSPSLTFSDVKTPGQINYRDISAAYDTADAINSLAVSNQTCVYGSSVTTDTTYLDKDSADLYGTRSASLTTCLRDEDVDSRVSALINSKPDFVVDSLTVNVVSYPELASIDLFTPVTVLFRDFSGVYQIVGIEHSVSPFTWLVTLRLRKER